MEESNAPKDPRRACIGDCLKIELHMEPEDNFVPDSLFDTKGTVKLVLGWGDFLPGLHELLLNKVVGDSVTDVSIDAGWGRRQDDLILKVDKRRLQRFTNLEKLSVGEIIQLNQSMQVVVTGIVGDMVIVDGNPPLAGSSYRCSFIILEILEPPRFLEYEERLPGVCDLQVASFSLGCFWGAQLAFDRLPGVVGTRVGYTKGLTKSKPSYDEVCDGSDKHREAVLVIFDPQAVKYAELVRLALERLSLTTSSLELHHLFEPNQMQYAHGCYYHTPEQREIALRLLEHNKYGMEVLPATVFFEAEDEHQKFLYKGGQSQRKGAKESIRCFG
jgi:peptide-methionine (S)-S-oxide reductase